ncbi:MAG: hypothetical protein ACJ789_08940 [Thermomicrobiales bacterium]
MAQKFEQNFIRPAVVPLVAAGLAALFIVTIGKTLLHLYEKGKPELERQELLFGVGLALAVLGIGAFVVSRPRSGGKLDQPVALGHRAMFEPPLPPVDVLARNGPLGTVADIKPGDALYAQSGQLAKVIGVLPGGEEWGQRYKGYIYAEGVFGATDELWIPVEAVVEVYPETHSAFLAIKGDETETYGWNRPPAAFVRTPRAPEPPKAL